MRQRSYRLRFFDWKTLAHFDTEPILAGTSIERTLPDNLLLPSVKGRVLSRGEPVADATVQVHITMPNGDQEMGYSRASKARSAADGTFELEDVPPGAKLLVLPSQPHTIAGKKVVVADMLAKGGVVEVERATVLRVESQRRLKSTTVRQGVGLGKSRGKGCVDGVVEFKARVDASA